MRFLFSTRYTFFLLLACGIGSCKKENVSCAGNCVDITVSGRAYDATTNKGFAHIPVTVTWYSSDRGIFYQQRKQVFDTKTDREGNFSFVITVDSTLFSGWYLSVKVPLQSGYLKTYTDFFVQEMNDFEPVRFRDIDFAMYPRAPLTIRFHRAQADGFISVSAEHSFGTITRYADLLLPAAQVKDTVVQTETAANVHTIIHTSKLLGLGRVSEQFDSIYCTQNGSNVIDINY